MTAPHRSGHGRKLCNDTAEAAGLALHISATLNQMRPLRRNSITLAQSLGQYLRALWRPS